MPGDSNSYALEMIGISKRFPGTLAVDGVDFSVLPGEAHALLGENGAGKSTLMKVLAGEFSDYTGETRVHGQKVSLHSPVAAKAHGIEMIHQELSLSLPQTIAENILAGRLPTRAGVLVDEKAMVRQAKECMARLGLGLDPMTPVERLSQNEAQLIEIAKALGSDPKILVMDEPTSALTRDDVEILFAIIRRLKAQGLAIVYISHHLSEVFQIGDRATVLRDGKLVGVRELEQSSPEELVGMMVGAEGVGPARAGGGLADRANTTHTTDRSNRSYRSYLSYPSDPSDPSYSSDPYDQPDALSLGQPLLSAEGLTRNGFFRDVSLTLHAGEIVGLCGLAGSGRTELARSICGIDPVHEGRLSIPYPEGAPFARPGAPNTKGTSSDSPGLPNAEGIASASPDVPNPEGITSDSPGLGRSGDPALGGQPGDPSTLKGLRQPPSTTAETETTIYEFAHGARNPWSLRQAQSHGVAYLTEDRKKGGLALRLDMRENALSARIPWSGRGPLYRARAGEDILRRLIKELQITPPDPRRLVRSLSGGNQQKVLLAKWLAVGPKVLVLDEPTRGVDVGAKALIHEAIVRLAAEGRAVLLISSDLPELTQLSDRILVMRQGRLIGELPKEKATEETLLLAANGVIEG